jgi:hypothetical protein
MEYKDFMPQATNGLELSGYNEQEIADFFIKSS